MATVLTFCLRSTHAADRFVDISSLCCQLCRYACAVLMLCVCVCASSQSSLAVHVVGTFTEAAQQQGLCGKRGAQKGIRRKLYLLVCAEAVRGVPRGAQPPASQCNAMWPGVGCGLSVCLKACRVDLPRTAGVLVVFDIRLCTLHLLTHAGGVICMHVLRFWARPWCSC